MDLKEADYIYQPGVEELECNEAAQELATQLAALVEASRLVDQRWAALFIVGIFAKYDNVASFTLGVSYGPEGDDEGRFWLASEVDVESVALKDPNVEGWCVDEASMRQRIYEEFRGHEPSLINAFLGPGEQGYESFEFGFGMVSDLLSSGRPIPGQQAVQALFPVNLAEQTR